MTRPSPRSTPTDTLVPDTTLFGSHHCLRSQSPPLPLALQAGRRWGGRLCQFRRWLRGCRGRLCRRLSQGPTARSEEHTSELQSLMRITYAVFCLKKKIKYKPLVKTKKAI